MPMEGSDGSVARDPIGDRPSRYRNAVFSRDTTRGLFLRMAEVVEAQCSCDDARGIFDAFKSCEGRKVPAAVLATINLELPKAVLAQAALDDPAPVANWTEIRLGLDSRTQGRTPLQQASHSLSLLRGPGPEKRRVSQAGKRLEAMRF